MRGTEATLLCRSCLDYARATDETHATYLIQAHLIETLSAVGREHFDFYFLRVRDAVEEFQISGALQAMELARQEGHIRFLGIVCDGPALATLGQWQFHDAFETLLVRRNPLHTEDFETLAPLAKERRVGIVTEGAVEWQYGLPFPLLREESVPEGLVSQTIGHFSFDHPLLVEVGSAEEIETAIQSIPSATLPDALTPYIGAARQSETWKSFENSLDSRRRTAFRRWSSE